MKRKVLVLALTLIGALAAAVGGYASSRPRAPGRGAYRTAAVQRARIIARAQATGTLSALVTVQVGSQISGRLQEIAVDFNSKVKKGQVLAKIEPQLLQAAVAQAEANLQAAWGQLAKARANAANAAHRLGRAQTLTVGHLIAEADLEQAQADADAAKADVAAASGNVQEARASLQQAQANLSYATIISPVDGVVISRNVDVGQTVAASLQAPTLFTIAGDLTKMQVDTSVAESDVGKLRAAMPATFSVDAYPSDVFKGVVREVRNAPQSVQGVVTYDAVVDVDNADLRLKPGMSAHVSFVYAERDGVLGVPNAALRFRAPPEWDRAQGRARGREAEVAPDDAPSPEQRDVWVLRGGVPTRLTMRVGVTNGRMTEVTDGTVRPGDEVIVESTARNVAQSTDRAQSARLF